MKRYFFIAVIATLFATASQPASAQIGNLMKKAKSTVNNTTKKVKNAVSSNKKSGDDSSAKSNGAKKSLGGIFSSSPKEVELYFQKNWGTFYPKENRLSDGETIITLKNNQFVTNNGKVLGAIEADGTMTNTSNNHRIQLDTKRWWVFDNGKVVGTLAAKKQDERDLLALTNYGYYTYDGLVGKASDLKKLDLRLIVWLYYGLKGDSWHKDAQDLRKRMTAEQKNLAKNAKSDISNDLVSKIANAMKQKGLLNDGSETGRVIEVTKAESNWNYLWENTVPRVPRERYMDMYVTILYNDYYVKRKYLISQLYKAGNESSDASYAAPSAPRPSTWEGEVVEAFFPIYK